jgi:hypothetical protein
VRYATTDGFADAERELVRAFAAECRRRRGDANHRAIR